MIYLYYAYLVPGSRASKNAVLKLLMILADTKDTCDKSVIGHQFKAPVAAIGDTVCINYCLALLVHQDACFLAKQCFTRMYSIM